MARLNILKLFEPVARSAHARGCAGAHISPEQQLRRSVLACMLWESQFYEDGVEIAGRIASWCPRSQPRRWPRWPSRRARR